MRKGRPTNRRLLIQAAHSAKAFGGFHWLVSRKAREFNYTVESAAVRALQELRQLYPTDAEFACCPLFPEILSYYGEDMPKLLGVMREAGV